MCAFFGFPHAGHWTRLLTSFNALPANCRCLFFICDVFFFGTARSIPSHISKMAPGIFKLMAGIVMLALGRIGDQETALVRAACKAVNEEPWKARGSRL
jgi:hypothetical protein